jgi:hypothetical protein
VIGRPRLGLPHDMGRRSQLQVLAGILTDNLPNFYWIPN